MGKKPSQSDNFFPLNWELYYQVIHENPVMDQGQTPDHRGDQGPYNNVQVLTQNWARYQTKIEIKKIFSSK